MCIGAAALNLSNVPVFSSPPPSLSLSRKMSGRMTGCHFTPSRGCSISSTWWRTLMETGRPESYGQSYRFSIRNKTTCTLCECVSDLAVKVCLLCLLFTAEDSSVFQRCGSRPCSPPWRLMGRQCGRMCRRPSHLWSSFFLWPFRVWAWYCRDVRRLQQLFLLCLPWKDSSSTRLCEEKPALPTLPLSESLEPLWWWLQGLFNKDYEEPTKIIALTFIHQMS